MEGLRAQRVLETQLLAREPEALLGSSAAEVQLELGRLKRYEAAAAKAEANRDEASIAEFRAASEPPSMAYLGRDLLIPLAADSGMRCENDYHAMPLRHCKPGPRSRKALRV